MEQAVAAMGPAADKLKGAKWQDALAPEQKALQYLLRAEATFRDIQVAFGQQGGGGGGGGGGATRDLEGLFDLELDTEKNQYEGAKQTQSADEQTAQDRRCDAEAEGTGAPPAGTRRAAEEGSADFPAALGAGTCCAAKPNSCASRWSR